MADINRCKQICDCAGYSSIDEFIIDIALNVIAPLCPQNDHGGTVSTGTECEQFVLDGLAKAENESWMADPKAPISAGLGEFLPPHNWREIAGLAMQTMLQNHPERSLSPGHVSLTTREREIIELASEGMSVLDIAQFEYISLRTVTTHLVNIYEKMGVKRLHQAVAYASKNGLIHNSRSDSAVMPEPSSFDVRSRRMAATKLLLLAAARVAMDDEVGLSSNPINKKGFM